jgi:hypothetical protein
VKQDTKALLWSFLLIALGIAAFQCAVLLRSNPDSPNKVADLICLVLGASGLLFVLIGSVVVLGAAIAFSIRMSPGSLLLAAVAFLSVTGALWGISRMFVITTYAWTPLLLPWLAMTVSGALLLFVAVWRFVVAKLRS